MKIFIALLVILLLISCTPNKSESLKEYQEQINKNCETDLDCTVKNTGNCCGDYQECVNKNFSPNLNLVKELCSKENNMGICGFKEINKCGCVDKKCEEV